MKNKLLATLGSGLLGLAVSASSAFAGYMVPGETMGVSALSPLPEGVFLVDTNNYGKSDGSDAGLGVAIPIVIWSTPFSFYNTRLEIFAAFPFAYVTHTAPGVDGVHALTFAVGPAFAHDFGNGLTGGVGVLFRSPDPDNGFANTVDGRTTFEFDIRQSLQYVVSTPGIFNGVTLIENAAYTTPASSYGPVTAGGAAVQNDFFAGDFTIEKTFGKLTVGFTGYGDIDTTIRNLTGRHSELEVGGLVGYDFGRFSLTGIVTRSVIERNSLTGRAPDETRGWLRAIIPLYVAPTAPAPVVARY